MRSMVPNCAMVMLVGLLLVASVPPGAAAGQAEDEIATGHIEAGIPHGYLFLESAYTLLWGTTKAPLYDTPFGFVVDIHAQQGDWIEGQVNDNTGTGYFVDMVFYDEQQRRIFGTECPGADDNQGISNGALGHHEIQPLCKVPQDAAWLVVTAHTGADLDVRVVKTTA